MVSPKTQAEAPVRSLDQRMEALKRANDIRVRRARLKKDLKDGRISIEQILSNPPEYVSTAKAFDMLMAVPKFGRVKAARFLNTCRISQSKTFGGLSDRKRTIPDGWAIFVRAPTFAELERRLRARATETGGEIEKRLERAKRQLDQESEFDHVIVNDAVDRAAEELFGLVQRELRGAGTMS